MTEQVVGEWSCSNDEYHANYDWISRSMLEDFRDSVVNYAAVYVYKTKPRQPNVTKEWMRMGPALHVQLLEFEKWDDLIVVSPEMGPQSKAFADFSAKVKPKLAITPDDDFRVKEMAKSALRHPEVIELMRQPGFREVALRCRDNETGIPIKCKPDIRLVAPVLVDFKSARDVSPSGWASQAANLGYDRQNAFYVDVVETLFGQKCSFVNVVIQNEAPWECGCFYIEDEDIEIGRAENSRWLEKLKGYYESGDWRARQNKKILKIKLPKWGRIAS